MSDHNEIAFAFIKSLKPLLIKPGKESFGEIMTTYESITMGIMVLLMEVFDLPPHEATRLVDMALDQAIKRFAAENNKETKQ